MTAEPALGVRLVEWEQRSPASEGGSELRDVRLSDEAARQLARRLTDEQRLEVRELLTGLEVGATSFVGRVRLGNVQITVEPKMGGNLLLRLFRYAHGYSRLTLLPPSPSTSHDRLFLDVVIAQLQAEVTELIKHGLSRQYEPLEADLMTPRGRIDMSALAMRSGRIDAGLPCRFHPQLADTVLNQVVLAGLKLAAQLTSETALKAACARSSVHLASSVSSVPLTYQLLSAARRRLNRLVRAYLPILSLIEMLWTGVSLDASRPEEVRLPGFLYDMNMFFQALVSRLLSESGSFEVRDERSLHGMIRYAPSANPRNRRGPRPRPDFAVIRAGQTLTLLDAKYRDLWTTDLPREWLYQLVTYGLSLPQPSRVSIVYPTLSNDATDQIIEVSDALSSRTRTEVILRPVHLPTLVNLVEGSTATADRRRRFADSLVFGA